MAGDVAGGRPPDTGIVRFPKLRQDAGKCRDAVCLSHYVGMERDTEDERPSVALGRQLLHARAYHGCERLCLLMALYDRGEVFDFLRVRNLEKPAIFG